MKCVRSHRICTTLLFSSVSLLPVAAYAQTGAASTAAADGNTTPQTTADLTNSNEIIVTATRTRQTLQDVPMSINVVTGSQLTKLNLFDTKDIQQLAPGLQLTNTGGRNNISTLRGVSFDPDSGTAPAVDIYYNEIPVDAQTVFTALYDIDQIEVLRGPQGALRGRTSPGGAITIATRKPNLSQIDGYAQVTGATLDAKNVQGGVSLTIVTDRLAIRVAMLIDHNRVNDLRDVNNGMRSDSTTMSGRLSVAWAPIDNLRVDLAYQYLYANNYQLQQVIGTGNAGNTNGPPATLTDRIAVSDGASRFQNTTHLLTGSVTWDIGNHTLSLLGAHQSSLLPGQTEQDGANAVPGYAPFQVLSVPYLVDTAELRLESHFTGFWNYSLDAFYTKQTGLTTYTQPNDLFFGPFPYSLGLYIPLQVTGTIPVNSHTFSLAAGSRFQITDKLRFELAARYSFYHAVQTNTTVLSSPLPSLNRTTVFSNTNTPKALTGMANLTYAFSREVTGYVAYGRSFRPGTTAVTVGAGVTDPRLLHTADETSDSVEAGVKTSLLDHRMSFNLSAYYQKYGNFISRTPGGVYSNVGGVTGGSQYNFTGNVVAKGIEAELTGRVNDNLDLSISAAYSHARYQNASMPCNDYNGSGVPNTTGTPKVTGSGQVSFCIYNGRLTDVPDFALSSNGEFHFHSGTVQPFLRYLVSYRPSLLSTFTNNTYPSRTNVNLYIGVRGPNDRWVLTAFVKNLLDQQRVTSISTDTVQLGTFGAPYQSGYYTLGSTVPRQFGGTLQFNF